jgi:hypothetical protein
MSETRMISARKISDWAGRCLVFTALVVMIGCAEDSGRRDSAGTEPGSTSDSKMAKTATATAQAEDVRFVATEELNTKMWKASGPTTTAGGGNTVSLNIKNRGSKPLMFTAVNMLSADHGFAIDSMKVQTILKPGEEKIISVPMENIDPTVSEHRVYCQLHPKHVTATVVILKDQTSDAADTASPTIGAQGAAAGNAQPGTLGAQDATPDAPRQPLVVDPSQRKATAAPDAPLTEAGSIAPGSQTGETSSRITGESEGQRVIREQSQHQREIESTSRSEQAPGSTDLKGCEGFPGFDRGCPGGPK